MPLSKAYTTRTLIITGNVHFKEQGPLDMRMEKKGVSAEELLNNTSEKQLADIIFNIGDEKEGPFKSKDYKY